MCVEWLVHLCVEWLIRVCVTCIICMWVYLTRLWRMHNCARPTVAFTCKVTQSCVRDMTHWYVCVYDFFMTHTYMYSTISRVHMCAEWLIHVCVTWLTYTCIYMTPLWRSLWRIRMCCEVTHSCVNDMTDWYVCVCDFLMTHTYMYSTISCISNLYGVTHSWNRDTTHFYVYLCVWSDSHTIDHVMTHVLQCVAAC